MFAGQISAKFRLVWGSLLWSIGDQCMTTCRDRGAGRDVVDVGFATRIVSTKDDDMAAREMSSAS